LEVHLSVEPLSALVSELQWDLLLAILSVRLWAIELETLLVLQQGSPSGFQLAKALEHPFVQSLVHQSTQSLVHPVVTSRFKR
jgi:hypothetical protein